MSQRESGYARKERDLYETPEWVTKALLPHLTDDATNVWEPAAGNCKMADVLSGVGYGVFRSDIELAPRVAMIDFMRCEQVPHQFGSARAIITNPPYELATEFCERALRLMKPVLGVVAMLLRTDFDHAKSRSHLFRDCPAFAKKLVLTKRIVWFAEPNGKPKAQPSFNHAWFIWDWRHDGPPVIGYAP